MKITDYLNVEFIDETTHQIFYRGVRVSDQKRMFIRSLRPLYNNYDYSCIWKRDIAIAQELLDQGLRVMPSLEEKDLLQNCVIAVPMDEYQPLALKQEQFNDSQQEILRKNCLQVVEQLHKANYVHRNLSPWNIFCNSLCEVKITGFHLAVKNNELFSMGDFARESKAYRPDSFSCLKDLDNYAVEVIFQKGKSNSVGKYTEPSKPFTHDDKKICGDKYSNFSPTDNCQENVFQLFQQAAKETGVPNISFILYQPEQDIFLYRDKQLERSTDLNKFEEKLPLPLINLAYHSKQPIYVTSSKRLDFFRKNPFPTRKKHFSLLVVPICQNEQVQSIAVLENDLVSDAFSPQQVSSMTKASREIYDALIQSLAAVPQEIQQPRYL